MEDGGSEPYYGDYGDDEMQPRFEFGVHNDDGEKAQGKAASVVMGVEEGEGPPRPYEDVKVLPERHKSQTDELNARLLASFDKLLSQGFKPPVHADVDWEEQESAAKEWAEDE